VEFRAGGGQGILKKIGRGELSGRVPDTPAYVKKAGTYTEIDVADSILDKDTKNKRSNVGKRGGKKLKEDGGRREGAKPSETAPRPAREDKINRGRGERGLILRGKL